MAAYEARWAGAYAASKGGIVSLTLQQKFAQFGIRVNAIAPGCLNAFAAGFERQVKAGLSSSIPFQRDWVAEEYKACDAYCRERIFKWRNNKVDGALRMQPK